jgi:hypothetical protein
MIVQIPTENSVGKSKNCGSNIWWKYGGGPGGLLYTQRV